MQVTQWIVAVLMLLSAALAAAPSTARAQSGTETGDGSSVSSAVVTGEPGEEIERWWGVAGAVICGGELWLLRNQTEIGLNPYVLAAGIGGCALALLDVVTTN